MARVQSTHALLIGSYLIALDYRSPAEQGYFFEVDRLKSAQVTRIQYLLVEVPCRLNVGMG
jgi:hypothetical protein